MENLKAPMTPESDWSCKSKAITQSPAHGPKGTGTAKEKGLPLPMPGEDCACKSKGIAPGLAMTTRKLTTATGKDRSRKSKEIASTPARGPKGTVAVTPGDQPISKRKQQSSKKKQEAQKQTMDQFLGGGERIPPTSKGGTPIQLILLQRLATPLEITTGPDDTVGRQLKPNLPELKGEGRTTAAKDMEVDLEAFKSGV